jgi:hypothetical protein
VRWLLSARLWIGVFELFLWLMVLYSPIAAVYVSNKMDIYTTGYNSSQITICHIVICFDWILSTSDHTSLLHYSVVLQAGRSPVRVPVEVDFFNLPNPSSGTVALGSTQPLTKMSTRNIPGGKKRPARRADILAAIYEPNV